MTGEDRMAAEQKHNERPLTDLNILKKERKFSQKPENDRAVL